MSVTSCEGNGALSTESVEPSYATTYAARCLGQKESRNRPSLFDSFRDLLTNEIDVEGVMFRLLAGNMNDTRELKNFFQSARNKQRVNVRRSGHGTFQADMRPLLQDSPLRCTQYANR